MKRKHSSFFALWVISMVLLFLFCLGAVYLLGQAAGCSSVSWDAVCRHDAVICALVAEEQVGKESVTICIGRTPKQRLHAQAKALVNGKWVWLHNWDGQVYDAGQDDFVPDKCISKEQVIQTYFHPRKGPYRDD